MQTKPFLQKKTLDKEYLEYKKRKKRLTKLSQTDARASIEPARSPVPPN